MDRVAGAVRRLANGPALKIWRLPPILSPPGKLWMRGEDMGLDEIALDRIRAIGGPVLLGRMAVVFIEDVPKRLDRLRAASANGDRAMVARMAHSIRGSAASLGGGAAVDACLALELAARTDGADLDAAVVDAERAIADLRRALQPLTLLAA